MDLSNLYISPTESCNLSCRACYTTKTKNILSNNQILDFVKKLSQHQKATLPPVKGGLEGGLKSIIFCGGEVFLLPDFVLLINKLISDGLFITIITNGTIDRLSEISDPRNCQLIVSFDGPKEVHDNNRGSGNFDKSYKFVDHALALSFPTEIFFLITQDSYPFRDSFNIFDLPKTYLTDRLGSLTKDQVLDIKRNYPTYPSRHFGCATLALQSNGLLYGCCESQKVIGSITDDPKIYLKNFQDSFLQCHKCEVNNFSARSECVTRLWRGQPEGSEDCKNSFTEQLCGGCCDPEFLCGYNKELDCKNCHEVFKLFRH